MDFFYEDEILETGGGIYNARSFFEGEELGIVINSDILTYIQLDKYISEHIKSNCIVSMLMKPLPEYEPRSVPYNYNGILGFSKIDGEDIKYGTFTGIHIFKTELFSYMQEGKYSIIETYRKLLDNDIKIGAISIDNNYWTDMGTPERLSTCIKDFSAFNEAGKNISHIDKLFEGGSDKSVFRIYYKNLKTAIIMLSDNENELLAWKEFSKFFENSNFNIPKVIKNSDNWLLMEDGGEKSLYEIYEENNFKSEILEKYLNKSMDLIYELSKIEYKLFPVQFCYQYTHFNVENMLADIEYFNKYYLEPQNNKLTDEQCKNLATDIYSDIDRLPISIMHRDFQSTNIILEENGKLNVIDIQTMRTGYSAYDFASLIFDSYLPFDIERIEKNIEYMQNLISYSNSQMELFWSASLIRLIQNLGAFGNLGRKKSFFKDKLTSAKKRLLYILDNCDEKYNFLKSYIKHYPKL